MTSISFQINTQESKNRINGLQLFLHLPQGLTGVRQRESLCWFSLVSAAMSGWWEVFHTGGARGIHWGFWVGQISKGSLCSSQFLSRAAQSSSSEECHLHSRRKRTLSCPVGIPQLEIMLKPITVIHLGLTASTSLFHWISEEAQMYWKVLWNSYYHEHKYSVE